MCNGYLLYFVVHNLVYFPCFGTLYLKKSGNPGNEAMQEKAKAKPIHILVTLKQLYLFLDGAGEKKKRTKECRECCFFRDKFVSNNVIPKSLAAQESTFQLGTESNDTLGRFEAIDGAQGDQRS
jgi:hypothetical protein